MNRGARVLGVIVLLTACASVPPPATSAHPGDVHALDTLTFRLVIDSLTAEIRRERPISPAVILAPVHDAPQARDLDAHLIALDATALGHRARIVAEYGFGVARSLGWDGCPSMMAFGADMSRCPPGDEVTFAIGIPRPARSVEEVMAGGAAVPADAIVVTTMSTVRSSSGAHTRVMDVIFVWTSGGPVYLGRRYLRYYE